MPDTKGVSRHPFKLASGDEVHIFSNLEFIRLQLRHTAHGEEHSLDPSFKIGVELLPIEAISLASALLTIAMPRLPKKEDLGT